MNSMVTIGIAPPLKAPMERFLDENPPQAHTLKAWQMASKADIPQRRYAMNAATQMPM